MELVWPFGRKARLWPEGPTPDNFSEIERGFNEKSVGDHLEDAFINQRSKSGVLKYLNGASRHTCSSCHHINRQPEKNHPE